MSDKEKAVERLRANEALKEDLAIANKRIEKQRDLLVLIYHDLKEDGGDIGGELFNKICSALEIKDNK